MTSHRQAVIECARTVFVKRTMLGRLGRQKVRISFAGLENGALEKCNCLVEHAAIVSGLDVLRSGKRQPYGVVGDSRAHALTKRRQPPMLHVPGAELTRGGTQQMLSRDAWLRYCQRHYVLK